MLRNAHDNPPRQKGSRAAFHGQLNIQPIHPRRETNKHTHSTDRFTSTHAQYTAPRPPPAARSPSATRKNSAPTASSRRITPLKANGFTYYAERTNQREHAKHVKKRPSNVSKPLTRGHMRRNALPAPRTTGGYSHVGSTTTSCAAAAPSERFGFGNDRETKKEKKTVPSRNGRRQQQRQRSGRQHTIFHSKAKAKANAEAKAEGGKGGQRPRAIRPTLR